MNRNFLFTAYLFLLGMLLACGGTGNRKEGAPSEPGPGGTENGNEAIVVSAKDLLDKYASDEASANNMYKSKLLEIEAEVVKGADSFETSRLIVKGGKGALSILCTFGKEWTKELAKVHVGERKTIRGRCMGKYPSTLIPVWLEQCSFPDALPASSAEVRADQERMKVKQDALLVSLKKNNRPIFNCALDYIKKDLPERFGPENTKDATITMVNKRLEIDPSLKDESGRTDNWVVRGRLTSKDRQGKERNMNWEVTVIAKDGKLSGHMAGIDVQP